MTDTEEWKPFTGEFEKRWYNLKLHSGKTVLACWPHAGNFHSFNDQDAKLGKITPDMVSDIQIEDKPFFDVREHKYKKGKKHGSRKQNHPA